MYYVLFPKMLFMIYFYRITTYAEIVWKKIYRFAQASYLLWREIPLWGRVVIGLVPTFTYEGFKKMMLSVSC